MAKNRFLHLTIPIEPMANKESLLHPSGKFLYTPPEKKEYMKRIARSLRHYKGYFDGANHLRLTILIVCKRPDTHPKDIPSGIWKTQTEFRKGTRPDLDNFLKPFQDAASNHIIEGKRKKTKDDINPSDFIATAKGAGLFDDDSAICSIVADKIYCKLGEKPRIEFSIRELGMFYVRPDLDQ